MNNKYLKFINTLFIVLPMTLLMAFVGIVRNYGLNEGWFTMACKAWSIMFPVAYIAAFFIIPVAKRLAERVITRL